jgi:TorA maturation chaperone TorD
VSAELLRALAVLAEPPTPESSRLADLLALGRPPTADEFTELFAFQVYPYASVYTGAEGALGGEARDRVAGFWRVLGLVPPTEPDHVSALLGLYAELVERSRMEDTGPASEAWRRARAACLWEHLLSWLGPYLRKVEGLAPAPFRMWAAQLREVLWADARVVTAPPGLPLHLRLAPPLPEADADGDAWLSALLAPVRCGMILTRADLARAARDLGLGLRVSDRRAVLRALFGQDAPRASEWLAAEADAAATAAEGDTIPLGPVAAFWTERARETARALERARAGERIDGR